jgi:hypothetical protein
MNYVCELKVNNLSVYVDDQLIIKYFCYLSGDRNNYKYHRIDGPSYIFNYYKTWDLWDKTVINCNYE